MKRYREEERQVIEKFVAYRNEITGLNFVIPKEWLEDSNNSTPEVECIARDDSAGVAIALEHTIIPSYADQKADDQIFLKNFIPIESALKRAFKDFGFLITIPTFALTRNSDWKKTVQSVRDWLLSNLSDLPETFRRYADKEIPFELRISKFPGDADIQGFARGAPPHRGNMSSHLVPAFQKTLKMKARKFEQHKDCIRALLLESQDVSLVNDESLYKNYLRALRSCDITSYDEIWMARSSFDLFRCYHASDALMLLANKNVEIGPTFTAMWQHSIEEEDKMGGVPMVLSQRQRC